MGFILLVLMIWGAWVFSRSMANDKLNDNSNEVTSKEPTSTPEQKQSKYLQHYEKAVQNQAAQLSYLESLGSTNFRSFDTYLDNKLVESAKLGGRGHMVKSKGIEEVDYSNFFSNNFKFEINDYVYFETLEEVLSFLKKSYDNLDVDTATSELERRDLIRREPQTDNYETTYGCGYWKSKYYIYVDYSTHSDELRRFSNNFISDKDMKFTEHTSEFLGHHDFTYYLEFQYEF